MIAANTNEPRQQSDVEIEARAEFKQTYLRMVEGKFEPKLCEIMEQMFAAGAMYGATQATIKARELFVGIV